MKTPLTNDLGLAIDRMGMLLVVCLALRKPLIGAWGVPLAAVIGRYALAKILELGDHHILALTQGLVSGHTLKHLAAALAAWPVLAVMQNGAQARTRPPLTVYGRPELS